MATAWEYFLGSVAISFSLSPNIASTASPPTPLQGERGVITAKGMRTVLV